MPPQDPGFSPRSKVVADNPALESQPKLSQPSSQWVSKLIHHSSIRKKIGLGYVLALSVAIVGTNIGRLIGGYLYEIQAKEKLELARKETLLFHELRSNVLEARNHQQQFISLISQPEEFKKHYSHYIEHSDEVVHLLSEIKTLADSTNRQDLQQFLQNQNKQVEGYFQQVEALLKQINWTNLKPEGIPAAQQALIAFTNESVATDFDEFSEDIENLIAIARKAEDEAYLALQEAETLGTKVAIIVMLLSIAIATVIAISTSRAIARPIEAVTRVAQKATEEANFDLQAPVTTKDEVGVLAIAFNNLIHRVKDYTEKLELSRMTLERRVKERTVELWRKHEQLEEAHEDLQQLNMELISQADDLNQALQNLRETQAQLIQTEKMSSLGQMVAGVAHEINNPVNFIYGNLSYVNEYTQNLLTLIEFYQQRYPNPDQELQDYMEAIELDFLGEDLPKMLSSMKMGTDRIRQIVLSLRNFSRLDEAAMKSVDIHEGIDSTLLILNSRLKQGIEITKKYGDLPLVECYPAQLNQVFMNILSNAIDALLEQVEQPVKQIVIHTETVNLENNIPSVLVRICDNGPGVPPEIRAKLFEAFFTTKPVGKGTGLGLAICYQIVEKHGGRIEVISQVGQGTEFAIALPIQHS